MHILDSSSITDNWTNKNTWERGNMSRHDLRKKQEKFVDIVILSRDVCHHHIMQCKVQKHGKTNKQTIRLLSFVLQPKIQRSKKKGMGQGENVNVI